MSMNDPIADMLTRIRNAQLRHKSSVQVAATKLKIAIANVLKEEGFLKDVVLEDQDDSNNIQELTLFLKYYNGLPVIDKLTRCSKPGLRVYCSKNEIPQVMGGMGIAIISTSKGVMSDRKARALGEGGEVICFVS